MYGTPVEAIEPLKTLTLDLPVGVSFVTDPTQGYPALYLIGPVVSGVPLKDQAQIVPATRSFVVGEPLVTHTFTDPIPPGTYQVVVHQSRIKDTAGDALTLLDEFGDDWTGWTLTVLQGPRSVAQPNEQAPVVIEPTLNPPIRTLSTATVKLDGKKVPTGSGNLSGEILTVETSTVATVELRYEYLVGSQRTSLHELYQTKVFQGGDDGMHRTHFGAVGPMFDYKWATYYGTDYRGTLPVDGAQQLINATATTHAPKIPASLPLVSYAATEDDQPVGHPNTYDVVQYTMTPRVTQALTSLTSVKFVFPKVLADEDLTPATDPRLYPGAVYLPDAATQTANDLCAVLDLPVNARLRVFVDGAEVWWGQTRLNPCMVNPSRFYTLEGRRPSSPTETTDLEFAIWRAGMEILRLWKCSMPTLASGAGFVPTVFEEYILTRLKMGWERQDGFVGPVSVRLGDHVFNGISDNALRRNLAFLAGLLQDCKTEVPIFPDDEMYADVARIATEARPSVYPAPLGSAWQGTVQFAGIIKVGALRDPFEYSRRILGG